MAPTVCMAEVGERLVHMDHLLNLNCCFGEKRKHLQNRKRPNKQIQSCHKLQMGLIVEECLEARACNCERATDESDQCEQCNRTDRDSLLTITLRTLALLRRNQLLQHRLSLLQAETRAFVTSVTSSPEHASHVTAPN